MMLSPWEVPPLMLPPLLPSICWYIASGMARMVLMGCTTMFCTTPM